MSIEKAGPLSGSFTSKTEHVKIARLSTVPEVGIYWFTPDKSMILYASSIPISEGLPYGEWIISPDDHYHEWEKLVRSGFLDSYPRCIRDNYAALPRGRVSYHVPTSAFVVYHGSWLRKPHRLLINDYFHLPPTTLYELDDHYEL
jgi:hypothetical protein